MYSNIKIKMSTPYRHRIYDSILLTQDGKVGINTDVIGTESLNVHGDAKASQVITTEVTAETVTLVQQPPQTR